MTKIPTLKVECPKCEGRGKFEAVDGPGLRRLREAAGVTMGDVARALHAQVAGISAIEVGVRQASMDFAVRYVQAIDGLRTR